MKLILKGVLFYITIIAVVLVICSIDSLCDNNCLIPAILGIALLIYNCIKHISEEEADILTGSKFFKDMSDEW